MKHLQHHFYVILCGIFMINNTLANVQLSTDSSLQAVILAAGQGSRFKTGITKLIAPICGQPMVAYTAQLMHSLHMPVTAVIGYQKELVKKAIDDAHIPNIQFAEQREQLGTGHALLACKDNWVAQNIVVMNGDMPLVTADMITAMCDEHIKHNAAITISTSYNVDPVNAFGRIVEKDNRIQVIEKKHFVGNIQDHPYVNCGIYIINRTFLETFLSSVQQNEKTQEFYITDLVEIASNHDLPVVTVPFDFQALNGVNTFQELALVEQIKHDELVNYWMTSGVRFIMPHTVRIDCNVTIGRGTVIGSGAQLLNNTQIGEFCTINAHAVLDNAIIENNVTIGAQSIIENAVIATDTVIAPLSYVSENKQHPIAHVNKNAYTNLST